MANWKERIEKIEYLQKILEVRIAEQEKELKEIRIMEDEMSEHQDSAVCIFMPNKRRMAKNREKAIERLKSRITILLQKEVLLRHSLFLESAG